MGLGLILGGEGQTDEAVRHARQAIARQPKRAGFRVVLADILWQGGRREEALGALEEGERLAPGVPIYPYLRATKLAQMGRAADAVAALEQGHRLQRAAGLPAAESDRYTALVYASIDPPTAVAAWHRYVLAMSRIPRPTPRELTQLALAVAALEELTTRAAATPAPR
jgi:tetratricopeptide (TPR) repeat protein